MPSRRSIIGPTVMFLITGAALLFWLRLNVDSLATTFIQNQAAKLCEGSGFGVELGSAQIIDSVGLQLNQVRLIDQNTTQNVFEIDKAIVRFSTDVGDIILGETTPSLIEVDGARVVINDYTTSQQFSDRLQNWLLQMQTGSGLVPVKLRNSEIRLEISKPIAADQSFKVDLDILPRKEDEGPKVDLIYSVNASDNIKLRGRGLLNLTTQQWVTSVEECSLPLNSKIVEFIPWQSRVEESWLEGMQGRVVFKAKVQSRQDQTPKFSLSAKIRSLSLANSAFPIDIDDLSADLQITDQEIFLSKLNGKVDDGLVDLTYRQIGLLKPQAWRARGKLHDAVFYSKLKPYFPEFAKKFFRDFSPAGRFDLQFDIDSTGHRELTSQLTDMSFSFYKFPYRVEHCIGNVVWKNDQLDFKVQGFEQGQLVEFDGSVFNPGEMATYVFRFGTEGRIPIDEKLLGSLQKHPKMDKAFRAFRPHGWVSGSGMIKKSIPGDSKVKKNVQINLHDCVVRHESFDYPMQDVSGLVEITENGFDFTDVTGQNSSGSAICNGVWNPRDGLRLRFNCNSVYLDERLRRALTPELKEIWDGFRPSGQIKSGQVFVDYPPGANEIDVRVQANLGELNSQPIEAASIYPTWFPYRITNLKGNISIGDGVVALRQFSGDHERTRMSCNGSGTYSEQHWNVKLTNLLVSSLGLDESLFQALPLELANAIKQLQYQGRVNLTGEMDFSSRMDHSSSGSDQAVNLVSLNSEFEPVEVDWDLRIDVDQGKMVVGLPLENVSGLVR
ncbi:MAG: hypothetical protein AAGA30_14360, partial [Planctomycetota bacterium]